MDWMKWLTATLAAVTFLLGAGHLSHVLPTEWPAEIGALLTAITAAIAALQKKVGAAGEPQAKA